MISREQCPSMLPVTTGLLSTLVQSSRFELSNDKLVRDERLRLFCLNLWTTLIIVSQTSLQPPAGRQQEMTVVQPGRFDRALKTIHECHIARFHRVKIILHSPTHHNPHYQMIRAAKGLPHSSRTRPQAGLALR